MELRPEKIFIYLGLVVGLIFVFIIPPFQAPDEQVHFFRSYEISELHFLEKTKDGFIGDYLPSSIEDIHNKLHGNIPGNPDKKMDINLLIDSLDYPLNPEKRTFIVFPSTAYYTPISYIPQVIGIWTGRLASLSPLAIMYLARIANLLFWLTLAYAAIRITPIGKWVFFLLSLLPMIVFQSSSVSADPMTNGLSFLIIAIFLYYTTQKREPIKYKKIILIIILGVLLSLAKPMYILIPLLLLFIPSKQFNNNKTRILFMLGLLYFIIILNLGWIFAIKDYNIDLREGVNAQTHIQTIINNPVLFKDILVNTVKEQHKFYLETFIGRLGWLDTPLPIWIIISFYVSLILATFIDTKNNIKLKLYNRILFSGMFIIGIIMIMTALLVSWTPNSSKYITGVQGRYLIPYAPLLFFTFYNLLGKNQIFQKPWLRKLISTSIAFYVIIILIITINIVIRRYYI